MIRYLEGRFVAIAKQCKRYTVLTKNIYSKTVIKESQKAAMEEFVDNVKIVINALGYNVLGFSKPVLFVLKYHLKYHFLML